MRKNITVPGNASTSGAPQGAPAPDRPTTELPRKPSEVLDAAAALIEPAGAWTQGQAASDGRGNDVGYDEATCFCLFGAVRKSADLGEPIGSDSFGVPWSYVERSLPGVALILWNDERGRTQPEVVAALRKAADLARSEGQ